ncbi:MAG: hypothetical protein WCT85_07460 [Parachlamydiales bacterium]|jgi:hypothetical protein
MAIKPTLFNFDFSDCTCNCFFNPVVYINHDGEVEKFDTKKSKDYKADYQKSFIRLIEKIKKVAPDSICEIDSNGKTRCYDATPLKLNNKKLTYKLIKKINNAYAKGKHFVLLTPEGLACLNEDDKCDCASQTSTKAIRSDSRLDLETEEIEVENQDSNNQEQTKKEEPLNSNNTCLPF